MKNNKRNQRKSKTGNSGSADFVCVRWKDGNGEISSHTLRY